MTRFEYFGILALVCVVASSVHAAGQGAAASKPKVPIVSVVGCVSRTSDGTWLLTNATDGIESKVLFTSTEEIAEAKKRKLGTNQYKLIGTTEFSTKEELLKKPERAAFTRPEVANVTGQLQEGRKVATKGLLITAPNEKRLNLVSVIQIGDACK
jgi:hypothetical protein